MNESIKVGCIQIDARPLEVERNLDRAKKLIGVAKGLGLQLVVLPELCDVGYDIPALQTFVGDADFSLKYLSKVAREYDISIAAGLLEVENENRYNTLFVINPKGEVVAMYRKIHLFPLSEEERVFQRGIEPVTFDILGYKIGLLICFDVRFPELSRQYFYQKCDVIIMVSAFPFPRLSHYKALIQARAIENQVFFLCANRIGKDANTWFFGNSSIIDPWGVIMASAGETEEVLISAEISHEKIEHVRRAILCKLML